MTPPTDYTVGLAPSKFMATGVERATSGPRWSHVRDLLRELIVRDIKLRYRGSIFGVAWTLLNPIAELLVLMFIFSTVLSFDIKNYSSFLFTGLLVYGWFQSSLLFATGAIVNNRELVKRPGVPVIILPIVTVASTLVHFLIALPVLFALLMLTGTRFTGALLTLPALIAVQFALILGISYVVATVYVWFRDTQYLLRVALQLLFYLTPVFYETRSIPAQYQSWYHLNPMVWMLSAYRAVLMDGALPDPHTMLSLVLMVAGLLIIGIAVFTRASHLFADEL